MACGCGNCSGTNQISSSTCLPSACGDGLTCANTCQQPSCSCGCGASQGNATPTPYYLNGQACQEDHARVIVQQQYVTGVTVSNSFNMPILTGTAVLTIPGLQKIIIGSYLWNPNVGYLKVISFDLVNSMIVVQNVGQIGMPNEASPGDAIPPCTLFTVTDYLPPAAGTITGPASLFPFVAVDFTAPPVSPAPGSCINITVTNTNGLVLNQAVNIAGGVYIVTAIVSTTIITICNMGAGVSPGSPIIAQDANGNYITPIVPTAANSCENPPVVEGTMIVCSSGVQQPLGPALAGQVPVATGTDDNVSFAFLDLPTNNCTAIVGCLNILNGIAQYTVVVTDSTLFVAGDPVHVHGNPSLIYEGVVDVVAAPNVTFTLAPVPAANFSICDGGALCQASCCDRLQVQINDIDIDISNLQNDVECAPQVLGTTPVSLNATALVFGDVANQPMFPNAYVSGTHWNNKDYAVGQVMFNGSYSLKNILINSDCDTTIMVEAHVSVGCVTQHYNYTNPPDAFNADLVYNEIEIGWIRPGDTEPAAPRSMGKTVWTEHGIWMCEYADYNFPGWTQAQPLMYNHVNGSFPAGADYPPGPPENPVATLCPMNHHQADIFCYIGLAPGQQADLGLFFKTAVNSGLPASTTPAPTTYYGAVFSVSGYVKFYRHP